MNGIHNKGVVTVIASIALLATGGCLANRLDLVERGIVTVEQEKPRHLRFMWLDAYTEDNGVFVSGTIRRPRQWRAPVRGVVDAQLLAPTGEILEEVETPYSPRSIPTKGARSSRFKVRLNTIPPEKSVVRIRHRVRASRRPTAIQAMTTLITPVLF
jgi:hypothetical protein